MLDRLLTGEVDSESVEAKKAAYDTANKEVAVLCNHQRAVPKGHVGQMEKLTAKMEALHAELAVRWRGGARGAGRRVVNPGPEGWDACVVPCNPGLYFCAASPQPPSHIPCTGAASRPEARSEGPAWQGREEAECRVVSPGGVQGLRH